MNFVRNVCGGNSFNTPNGSSIGNVVLLAGGQIGSDTINAYVYGGTSGTQIGDVIKTPMGEGEVVGLDILKRKCQVMIDDQIEDYYIDEDSKK